MSVNSQVQDSKDSTSGPVNVEALVIGEFTPPFAFHWNCKTEGGVLYGVLTKRACRAYLKRYLGKRYSNISIVEVAVDVEPASTETDPT